MAEQFHQKKNNNNNNPAQQKLLKNIAQGGQWEKRN